MPASRLDRTVATSRGTRSRSCRHTAGRATGDQRPPLELRGPARIGLPASVSPGSQRPSGTPPGPAPPREGSHRPFDRLEVVRIDDIEEMLADAAQMGPRRRAHPGETGVGQDGLCAAGVRQAGAPFHEPIGDESVDQAGDPALAEDHLVGQQAHPDPTTRRAGDRQEGVVLGEGKIVLGTQLLIEAARDPSVRDEEGAPRSQARIVGGERSGGRFGSWHGGDATPSMLAARLVVDNATIRRYS